MGKPLEKKDMGKIGNKSSDMPLHREKIHAVAIEAVTERRFAPATVDKIEEIEIDQCPDFDAEVDEICDWAD